jgi:pantoate--beta-alanine ligase
MYTVHTLTQASAFLDSARARGQQIGFVPTMGFLHAGHQSLMRRAVSECDVVIATIFVNPLQFAPNEDLAAYPRDFVADSELASEAGVSILLAPSVDEMYPEAVVTSVRVSELSDGLESGTRPTHFEGVATVVAKMFNIVGPCRAYFGEKDYQQLAVIRRMARDLSFNIQVVGCPIVREADGLAMSSRNTYLEAADREAATCLRRALDAGVALLETGERSVAAIEATMSAVIGAESLATHDNVAVRNAETLQRIDQVEGDTRLLVAAKVGPSRLIDNCAFQS